MWRHIGEAIRTITSWHIGTTSYAIIKCDLEEYPERDDWPNWKHPGNHEELARSYWNAFYVRQLGVLKLSDAPDFFGTMTTDDGKEHQFWGDFGQVSASTFALVQKGLDKGDLWISVLDDRTQIILEPEISIIGLVDRQYEKDFHVDVMMIDHPVKEE